MCKWPKLMNQDRLATWIKKQDAAICCLQKYASFQIFGSIPDSFLVLIFNLIIVVKEYVLNNLNSFMFSFSFISNYFLISLVISLIRCYLTMLFMFVDTSNFLVISDFIMVREWALCHLNQILYFFMQYLNF